MTLDPTNIPKHVALIMDGNGRWAKERGLPRIRGHEVGVERLEDIMHAAGDIGVKILTFYAFSKENWKRPEAEVTFLMNLLSAYLDKKVADLNKNNVVFNTIGRIEDLPEMIQKKIAKAKKETAQNTGVIANYAFSYSSRLEITRACQEIARKALKGEIKPEDITEETVQNHLDTAGMPDPDLLIRTSGELRISNFLLWQISYSELYVTEKYWPDFTREEFLKGIQEYQKRERRFGLTEAVERRKS
ncbi:MAG: isoprenyl transferase [Candidatus Omnitrophica bacterium]|nr:isoprenyl transferase [Candidatus Omnitrophota bacterium]